MSSDIERRAQIRELILLVGVSSDTKIVTIGSTWVDGMPVVEAPSNRVVFDDLIAHLEKRGRISCR